MLVNTLLVASYITVVHITTFLQQQPAYHINDKFVLSEPLRYSLCKGAQCTLRTNTIFLFLSHHPYRLGGVAPTPFASTTLPLVTSKVHPASRPFRHSCIRRDVRSLVGYPPEETPHCCRVASVVFGDARSDAPHAGLRLPVPPYWRQC